MARRHHVADTVTLSNHRIRDPSNSGTTLERFRVGSHGPGTADSILTQPGVGTRPLGRHSTGHPRGGNSSTVGSLDPAPIAAQSPARTPIGSSTRSPVTASRGAPIGTPPPHRFLESEVPGPADWSRGGRPATRNSKPGLPQTPAAPRSNAASPSTAVDLRAIHQARPQRLSRVTLSRRRLPAAAGALRFRSGHTLKFGGGAHGSETKCCAFRRTPRSTGTGGTETGCNNNDEVTANEPQRVKM